ncbi:hypothetical protein G3O00_14595 [Burkholderia sp. Ac-20384]|uniref:hypothetical protein n=1 Tax=Burkholderia sp. Ac-20384 TaxID=2703902 RepID=UPI00198086FA|nr:hypothetical protein [Burkholderia sp. Ac-20384]MBN3824838.1 hypothetical protein [Burkholderia sp. Ac-20384]
MKNEFIYLLCYSGMDRHDFDSSWHEQNEDFFCKTCHRQKYFKSALDVVLEEEVRERADIIFSGLIPGVMSRHMCDALGQDLDRYINIGKVFSQVGEVREEQPYVAFTGVRPYVTLRGRTPLMLGGRKFPEDERIYICPECGFKSRRERGPFFLPKSECPIDPISCAELGILVNENVYEKISQKKWKKVRVDKVEIVDE